MSLFRQSSTQSPLFRQADQWFNRARAFFLDGIPCQKGCFRCCIGPFPITLLDREEIHRGLDHLASHARQDIERQAREQVAVMEIRYPRLKESYFLDKWDDAVVDQLVAEFAELPCPALQSDGSCGIYECRPMACRTMGIPFEARGLVQGACDIQTFVPIRRLSSSIREQDLQLARKEAVALDEFRQQRQMRGEEMLLAYGFLGMNQ